MDIGISNKDLSALVSRLENDELSRTKRNELSKESFKVWLQDTFTKVALNLGYTIRTRIQPKPTVSAKYANWI